MSRRQALTQLPVRSTGASVKFRGVAPKAIVGAGMRVCMRRLVHVIYGVVNSGDPFDMAIPMRGLAFQDGI